MRIYAYLAFHVSFRVSISVCCFIHKFTKQKKYSGGALLKNARNLSSAVDLADVRFTFTRDGSNGEKPHVVSGYARDNGHLGCGTMKLRKDSKYLIEIDAGLSYYPYSSFIYTGDSNLELTIALMPKDGDKLGKDFQKDSDALTISLTWSERDPVDLDLYLFLPAADKTAAISQESMVYWASPTGMNETYNHLIKFENSDLGIDKITGRRSYGPESIRISGDLPLGTYSVMVHVHNPNGPDTKSREQSRLHGGGATVSVYSAMLGGVAPEGKFSWTVGLDDHLISDWWHVFNLEVYEENERTLFWRPGDASPGEQRIKQVVLHNVDKLVRPGLVIDEEGGISGAFPVAPHLFSDQQWLNAYQTRTNLDWRTLMAPRDGGMGFVDQAGAAVPRTQMTLMKYNSAERQVHGTWLEVTVLSAADMPQNALPLDFAMVTLIQDEAMWDGDNDELLQNPVQAQELYLTKGAEDLKLQQTSGGLYVGGYKYFGRKSKLLVTAAGFFPQIFDVELIASDYLRRVSSFTVPDDGLSRVILRWGNRPADCDIYLVPKDVVDAQSNPVAWRTDDGKRARTAPPYVFFNLCNCFDCTCGEPQLQASTAEQSPVLKLGRDDTTHGIDTEGVIANGPETMSLFDLLQGKYLVYINAGVRCATCVKRDVYT